MEVAQKRIALYDKKGEQHYDIISAFIKSIRGSDPNAAVYWLARMIEGGEDVKFIARRMVILASEDGGTLCPERGSLKQSAVTERLLQVWEDKFAHVAVSSQASHSLVSFICSNVFLLSQRR